MLEGIFFKKFSVVSSQIRHHPYAHSSARNRVKEEVGQSANQVMEAASMPENARDEADCVSLLVRSTYQKL